MQGFIREDLWIEKNEKALKSLRDSYIIDWVNSSGRGEEDFYEEK